MERNYTRTGCTLFTVTKYFHEKQHMKWTGVQHAWIKTDTSFWQEKLKGQDHQRKNGEDNIKIVPNDGVRWGTAVAQWLRCCDTNRKVAGSIPDGVIEILH